MTITAKAPLDQAVAKIGFVVYDSIEAGKFATAEGWLIHAESSHPYTDARVQAAETAARFGVSVEALLAEVRRVLES